MIDQQPMQSFNEPVPTNNSSQESQQQTTSSEQQAYTKPSDSTPQSNAAALATTINQYPIGDTTDVKYENEIDQQKPHESFLLFDPKTTSATERYVPKGALPHHGKHGYDSMLKLIADDLNFDDLDSNEQPSYSATRPPTSTKLETSTVTTTVAETSLVTKRPSATTNIKKKPFYKKPGACKY